MRKKYSESTEHSPSSRLADWLVDRMGRIIVTFILMVVAYFMVDVVIYGINFVQAAGETGVEVFNPDPMNVGLIRFGLMGIIIYLILFKRV
ncbi:MAG: hypothetical protein ACRC37_04025 [Lentisphaeria bacterium]